MFLSDIDGEKQHDSFKQGIEQFPKDSLHHTETAEKNPLPDQQSRQSCCGIMNGGGIGLYMAAVCASQEARGGGIKSLGFQIRSQINLS